MAGLGGVWPRSSLPSLRNGSVRHKRAQISGGTLCQAEVIAGLEPFGFGDASSRSTAQWNWVLPIRHAQPQTPRGTRHELTGDFAAPCPGQFERERPCRPNGATQSDCGTHWPCPHHCQSPSLQPSLGRIPSTLLPGLLLQEHRAGGGRCRRPSSPQGFQEHWAVVLGYCKN